MRRQGRSLLAVAYHRNKGRMICLVLRIIESGKILTFATCLVNAPFDALALRCGSVAIRGCEFKAPGHKTRAGALKPGSTLPGVNSRYNRYNVEAQRVYPLHLPLQTVTRSVTTGELDTNERRFSPFTVLLLRSSAPGCKELSSKNISFHPARATMPV